MSDIPPPPPSSRRSLPPIERVVHKHLDGRARRAWTILVAICILLISFGVYCFVIQEHEGDIVTGMRNPGQGGAAWGLYIAFYVVLVGVSFAGITVAAIARLFDVEALKPITRLAELLTITALIAGAAMVMSDLGRPEVGMMNLPQLANPTSPFFGTFTLVVAGYLFSSLVYFFLSGRADAAALAADPDRPFHLVYKIWASGYSNTPDEQKRHNRVGFILALSILPLLVTAHSTLGFIFGIQVGRPGWFSALQAPSFVILAGVSGTGALILLVIGMRRLLVLPIPDRTIRWLGNLMWVLALVYLYFIVVDELTATYASPSADRHVAHELTHGRFSTLFLVTVVSIGLSALIPLLLYIGRRLHAPYAALFVRGRTAVRLVAAASIFANIGAVLKRFLIVVPSQIEGSLLPTERGEYTPTLIEYGVVGGLLALMVLMILLFARFFPLVPGHHEPKGEPTPDRPRFTATALWVLFATVLIGVGLADSFRTLRPTEIDPTIPFAPVIFAVGVMALFSSAIVYEVFPRAENAQRRQ